MGHIQDFINQIQNDPHVQALEQATSKVGNGILQGANNVGKAIGSQPILNLPSVPGLSSIQSPTINDVAKATPMTAGIADLTSGNLQDYPKHLQEGTHKLVQNLNSPDINTSTTAMMGMVNPEAGIEKKIAGDAMPMITKAQAPDKAIANYGSLFDVTRSRSHNMLIHPETVINQLIDDGITHINGLGDLKNIAENVTGKNGAFPTINNHILSQVTKPLDYQPAMDAIDNLKKNVLPGEKPGFVNEVTNEVNKAFEPLNYNNVGLQGAGYAKDLYQTSQNLRDLQLMYKRQAYTAMGELQNPEHLRTSNAIMNIKNAVDGTINDATKGFYAQAKNDPFVQQQLQRVPAGIASRFMQGANVFKDGQAIQAPYVGLSHMLQDTRDTQMSVWTKAAKAMQDQKASTGVGQAVAQNVPGPAFIKKGLGSIAQKGASVFDKTPEEINQGLTSGESAQMNPQARSGLKKIVASTILTGGAIAGVKGLEAIKSNSNASSQPDTYNSNDNHNQSIQQNAGNVNTLPTDMQSIAPDPKTGRYSVSDPTKITGSDGNSLAITPGQSQNALAALDALVKQDSSYITNPIKAGQLQAARQAITDKAKTSEALVNSFQKNATVLQKIEDAQELLKKTSPMLTDKIGALEGGHAMLDPKYQSLVNDFSFIENSDPRLKGQLSNLATGESAKTALANAAKLLLSEHNQLLRSHGASNGLSDQGSAQQAPVSQLPASLPAPVNGSLPQIQSSGWQQVAAPNPAMGLAPIGGQ